MLVKIYFSPKYERVIECDTIHRNSTENEFQLSLYRDGKLIENPKFKEDSVDIYIIEDGKTVDRINFNPKSK